MRSDLQLYLISLNFVWNKIKFCIIVYIFLQILVYCDELYLIHTAKVILLYIFHTVNVHAFSLCSKLCIVSLLIILVGFPYHQLFNKISAFVLFALCNNSTTHNCRLCFSLKWQNKLTGFCSYFEKLTPQTITLF